VISLSVWNEPVLVKNVKVLRSGNSANDVIRADILVENGIIEKLGDVKSGKTGMVIDGKNFAAVPGFVNAHTHAAMTLFRGYAEDMPLMKWLEEKIWPLEKKLKPEHVYTGTKLACVEMLKSGCTAFIDMYFYVDAIASAVRDTGIRACISSAFFDFFNPDILEESLKRVRSDLEKLASNSCKRHSDGSDRIIPAVGPHAPYTVSLDGLKMSMEIAMEFNAKVHFHLAETEGEVKEFEKKNGRSVIRALDEIGFLNDRLIAAHCIWLSDGEIELLAKRGVNVAHCPVSNMKLCSGVFRYPEMLKAGVNVCLGTDGAASNNSLNMLEEMKFAVLLQKVHRSMPEFRAENVFNSATVNGYRALGLKGGKLEEGYLADFALYDLNTPSFCPSHSLLADIVYSSSNSVVYTFVGGEPLVVDGHYRSYEEELEIIEKARKVAYDLVS